MLLPESMSRIVIVGTKSRMEDAINAFYSEKSIHVIDHTTGDDGLSIGTTTAHIARAVYEGVAYGANHCIISMNKAGYKVNEIYASGGLAQSDFWMQMHADVIGVPMYTTVENQSAGCLGDCIIAAVGVGIYKDFSEAAKNMVRIDKKYTPNPEAHKEYSFYMERYMETWPQMRDIVHKTVDHNAK